MRFNDEVAIVTGAAGSIGHATCLRLAAEGARVIATDIDEEKGKAVAKQIVDSGGKGWFYPYDLANIDDRHRFVDAVVSDIGPIDILVNNAAARRVAGIFEVSPDDWDICYDVNVRGHFFLLQAVAAVMKDHGGGAIVNLSSISAKGYRRTGSIAYSSSKAAIVGITRTASFQLAPFNIRVNTVMPGSTRNEESWSIARKMAKEQGISEEEAWKIRDSEIPIGRSNEGDDVGKLISFLASSESSHVTGQAWTVDGGVTMD